MSKGPEIQVPESSGVLDFVALKNSRLPAVACISWAKGSDGRTRDAFRDGLYGGLQVLSQSSGLNVRVFKFAQALSRVYELPSSRTDGLEGFSIGIFRNYELGTSRGFESHLINYPGNTGILLPSYPDGNIKPRKNYDTDGNGLFTVSEPAPNSEATSVYSLVFSDEPFDIYLGLRSQLESMRSNRTLTPSSNTHGSLITNHEPASANVGEVQQLRRPFDPVYSD